VRVSSRLFLKVMSKPSFSSRYIPIDDRPFIRDAPTRILNFLQFFTT
jgi:hypothetical protein